MREIFLLLRVEENEIFGRMAETREKMGGEERKRRGEVTKTWGEKEKRRDERKRPIKTEIKASKNERKNG